MRAFELHEDGTRRPIAPTRGLQAACSGVPVLLEGALVAFGLQATLVNAFLDEVSALASPDAAARLRSAGLERLHDVLAPQQVADMLGRLDLRMVNTAVQLARAVVHATTDAPPHYFVCARMFVRAQIPLQVLEPHRDLMSAGHLEGHLRPVRPHRDVEFTHPRHSLSIWCAVGPVREGNTLALHVNGHQTPITPALAPGDLLLFDADHLHASVPNRTHETRVGVGTRVKVGRWLQFGPGTHWRPWCDASLLDTPLEAMATLQSRLTPAAFRRWRWRRTWRRQQEVAAAGR